jgi:predicted phosphodiesterase
VSKYRDVLALEQQFHKQQRLIKIWGNHDDAWRYLDNVKKHLSPLFNRIETYEAIQFSIEDENSSFGRLLLVHGHQGSRASDRFAGISKWFVRYFWRNFQRLFKIALSTPAKSKDLKDEHDIAMHQWAKKHRKQIIICGHTHQPVFMSQNHIDVLQQELESLQVDSSSHLMRIKEIETKLDDLNKRTSAIGTLVQDSYPCYFNTGCCSFSDGDITGIELSEGKIRLIKWAQDNRTVIAQEKLLEVLAMLD